MLPTVLNKSKANLWYIAGIFFSVEIITVILSLTDDGATSLYELIKQLFIGGSASLIVGSVFMAVFQRVKTAQDAQRRSAELSMTILNGMKDAVSIIDANTYRISGVNKAFLEEFAFRKEEVLGKTCHEVTHRLPQPCGSREHICPLERTTATGVQSVAEHTHNCSEGKEIYVEVSCLPIKNDEGSVTQVVHVARNITDRKHAEKELRESTESYRRLSQEFRTLLDAMPDRLFLLSPELRVQWTNKVARSEMGKRLVELTGEHCYKLWHSRSVPCEDCHALRSFQSGEVESSQHRTPDGKHWDSRAFPIRDDDGRIESVITVARDITEKVKMEEEAKLTQAKLIHINKMASLGILVSGIAHEINNPNNLIMFNGQIMSDIWKDALNSLERHHGRDDFLLAGLSYPEVKEAVPDLISGIVEGSRRIKNIVDNLRDYSRSNASKLDRKVHVNSVISTSVSILGSEIKKHTENFVISLDSGIPPVRGNSQQLEQVVINLIVNSLQSLPHKERSVQITTFLNGARVVMQVRDEGIGMSEEVLERIGEPFFTTKLNSGGTGLGLSICRSIIRDHRGSLEFASSPDRGTTVTVSLPLSDSYRDVLP